MTHLSKTMSSCGDYPEEGKKEMLIMETIRKIRLMYYREKKAIREISRALQLSRNTVRKALRSDATMFRYERQNQIYPKLGEYQTLLTTALEEDGGKPFRERRTMQVHFEELQRAGYRGGYDSVRRFVKTWRESRACRHRFYSSQF